METEIDIKDELEILCLLTSFQCESRYRLVQHFGFDINIECPARQRLKKEYDKWKAGKRANYSKGTE